MFTKFCTVQLGYKSMFKLWDDNYVFCLMKQLNTKLLNTNKAFGPLRDPITWYGISDAGKQVTQLDFQNKATRTSPA